MYQGPAAYTKAQSFCSSYNATLISVHSPEQELAIRAKLKGKLFYEDYWIGYSQSGESVAK